MLNEAASNLREQLLEVKNTSEGVSSFRRALPLPLCLVVSLGSKQQRAKRWQLVSTAAMV